MRRATFTSFLSAAGFAYNAGIHPARFFRAGRTWFVFWQEDKQ